MKWFVYPRSIPSEILRFPAPPDLPVLEFIPPSQSFLGPLIQQLELTVHPRDAEYFLVPVLINILTIESVVPLDILHRFFDSFPWFSQVPDRHVVFLLGDNSIVPPVCRESAVFMPSCSRLSRTIPMYYFTDLSTEVSRPISETDIEVNFQGTTATGGGLRERVVAALKACRSRAVSCCVTEDYFHKIPDSAIRQALEREFVQQIERSRFVFCPRGDGLSSLRFFETLALGRLPILVADEAALPLEGLLPYDHFMVRVPEARVDDWESYLDTFLTSHPDIDYCSSLARNVSRIWFSRKNLGRFVERSLEESSTVR